MSSSNSSSSSSGGTIRRANQREIAPAGALARRPIHHARARLRSRQRPWRHMRARARSHAALSIRRNDRAPARASWISISRRYIYICMLRARLSALMFSSARARTCTSIVAQLSLACRTTMTDMWPNVVDVVVAHVNGRVTAAAAEAATLRQPLRAAKPHARARAHKPHST